MNQYVSASCFTNEPHGCAVFLCCYVNGHTKDVVILKMDGDFKTRVFLIENWEPCMDANEHHAIACKSRLRISNTEQYGRKGKYE